MYRVDYAKCYTDLVERGGDGPRAILDEWESRSRYAHVREFAKGFVHEKLYQLNTDQIRAATKVEHALGDVEKEEQIEAVENFTCPFSWNDSFHAYIESAGKAPSFPEFRTWLTRDHPEFVWNDLKRKFPVKEERYQRAIRWRIGKVYYSVLREILVLTALREKHGITLNYHLVADVRLRVDFWKDQNLFMLYFPNRRYRAGSTGRKVDPATIYPQDKFKIETIEVHRDGRGVAWLPTDEDLDKVAGIVQKTLG